MKNIALALSLMLGLPTVILAQESQLPIEVQEEPKMSKRMKMMADDLQFTEDQIAQATAIDQKYKPHLDNARLIEDKAKKREAIHALRVNERAEIEALLTEEQLPLLEAYVEKRKASKKRTGAKPLQSPSEQEHE